MNIIFYTFPFQLQNETAAELVPCDVSVMLTPDPAPVDLILEGSHVGRGDQWVDTEDGIRRVFEVSFSIGCN